MYANPRKTTSVKHLGPVDIAAFRDDVLAIPQDVWDRENADKPNRFEALDKPPALEGDVAVDMRAGCQRERARAFEVVLTR